MHPRRRLDNLWLCFDPERGGGIFTELGRLGAPWSGTIDSSALDEIYLGTYSGSKRPAPVVCRMVLETEDYLTEAQVTKLATMIWALNKEDWARVWELELADYDPILNYDMEEELTDDTRERSETGSGSTTYGKTDTRTDNLTTTHDTTDTRTDALSVSRTGTDTTVTAGETGTESSSDRSVYGLNSADAVPSDKEAGVSSVTASETETLTHATTDSHTGTQTTARTGTDSNTGTQAHVSGGTDRTVDSRTSTETHEYRLTRKGNIGTMTTQDMIEQERTLRAWRLFYDRVFPDVDRVLTLSVY